jgi:hypothetical protein
MRTAGAGMARTIAGVRVAAILLVTGQALAAGNIDRRRQVSGRQAPDRR